MHQVHQVYKLHLDQKYATLPLLCVPTHMDQIMDELAAQFGFSYEVKTVGWVST